MDTGIRPGASTRQLEDKGTSGQGSGPKGRLSIGSAASQRRTQLTSSDHPGCSFAIAGTFWPELER